MERAAATARRVLILGGGFGGVAVAKELERLLPRRDAPLEVTLVSRENYLLFVPMLPEAATGSVELTHVLTPLRSLLPRTRLRIEQVQSIDLQRRVVTTMLPGAHAEHVLEWDDLVIALGNVVSMSELPGVAQHGLPIKTIGDALHIRNRAVQMLEAAENEPDPSARRRRLTFVVAGGGFSGVEVAAELNDFLHEAEGAHYPNITSSDLRVILLHSGERILPELSPGLAAFAQRKLAERGVELRLGVRLGAATAHEVQLDNGEKIEADTLIVAFGAATNPVVQAVDLPRARGRLSTDGTLRVQGQTNVWTLGDCAAVPNPRLGEPCPPTAQFAMRQGKILARNLLAGARGEPLRHFAFSGLGQLVSLGHRSAVAELPLGLKIAGFPAWLMWRAFYLSRLPGLERKLGVWLDWSLDLFFRRDLAELNVERTERLTLAHYEPGEAIIRQGELADILYVLIKGEVQVVREGTDGDTELARLRQGDIFGEVGLLRHQPRNATVRALTRVDVLMLGRQDFDLLARTWTGLGRAVESVASSRESGSYPGVKSSPEAQAPIREAQAQRLTSNEADGRRDG